MKHMQTICALFMYCAVSLTTIPAILGEVSLQQASWQIADEKQVQQQLFDWMQQLKPSAATTQAVEKLWESKVANATELTERINASLCLLDIAADKYLTQVNSLSSKVNPHELPNYENEQAPVWVKHHLRATLAITLTHLNLYDEAAEQFNGSTIANVIDPASLLFYRSVVEHKLLKKEACLKTVEELLENKEFVPQRYVTIASLMQADLQPVEPDSLEEISRLMDDVRRRLDLGRAGKKVRDEEAEIIAKLDKKIEDLEKKRKQQQQQQVQQSKNSQKPAEKSQIKGDLQATDEVDLKRFSKATQWGNLPPKQRQQALQQLGRDLPAHFRDIIEEYFKRLAQDGNQ